jgi:hypothetical protein
VTLAEIRFGIERVAEIPSDGPIAAPGLAPTLRPRFDGRVGPVTEHVMPRWRRVVKADRRRGIPTASRTDSSPPLPRLSS